MSQANQARENNNNNNNNNKRHTKTIRQWNKLRWFYERNAPEKTFSANLSNRLLLPTPTKYDINNNTFTHFNSQHQLIDNNKYIINNDNQLVSLHAQSEWVKIFKSRSYLSGQTAPVRFSLFRYSRQQWGSENNDNIKHQSIHYRCLRLLIVWITGHTLLVTYWLIIYIQYRVN